MKAWAAEGGGGNFDKSNVFDKRNVVVESMGCRGGGGKILIIGMFYIKGNVVVESMGCRGKGKLR